MALKTGFIPVVIHLPFSPQPPAVFGGAEPPLGWRGNAPGWAAAGAQMRQLRAGLCPTRLRMVPGTAQQDWLLPAWPSTRGAEQRLLSAPLLGKGPCGAGNSALAARGSLGCVAAHSGPARWIRSSSTGDFLEPRRTRGCGPLCRPSAAAAAAAPTRGHRGAAAPAGSRAVPAPGERSHGPPRALGEEPGNRTGGVSHKQRGFVARNGPSRGNTGRSRSRTFLSPPGCYFWLKPVGRGRTPRLPLPGALRRLPGLQGTRSARESSKNPPRDRRLLGIPLPPTGRWNRPRRERSRQNGPGSLSRSYCHTQDCGIPVSKNKTDFRLAFK